MKQIKKGKKGFTLVEVIISIAALGIICAVLLRLFVLSSDTNDAAKNAQQAELFAASVIESIACAETLENGFEALGLEYDETKTNYTLPENRLTAVIEISEDGDFPGNLYSISISVQSSGKQLAEITTKKYVQRPAYE